MNIGLDFDDVVVDTSALKVEYFKKIYNIDITKADCKRKNISIKGISEEDYTSLQRRIYDTEISLELQPLPYTIEMIKSLILLGNSFKIISSRNNNGKYFVGELLKKYSLDLPIACTSKESKKEYCRGLDAFVDDDIKRLEEVGDVVKHLFLFEQPHNLDVETNGSIKRVKNWQALYFEVRELNINSKSL